MRTDELRSLLETAMSKSRDDTLNAIIIALETHLQFLRDTTIDSSVGDYHIGFYDGNIAALKDILKYISSLKE